MTNTERTEAVIDWLLHPDRSYTPHELAMETVRRLREAEDATGAAITALLAEVHRRYHYDAPFGACNKCATLAKVSE
jgi:hypothetical protein